MRHKIQPFAESAIATLISPETLLCHTRVINIEELPIPHEIKVHLPLNNLIPHLCLSVLKLYEKEVRPDRRPPEVGRNIRNAAIFVVPGSRDTRTDEFYIRDAGSCTGSISREASSIRAFFAQNGAHANEEGGY